MSRFPRSRVLITTLATLALGACAANRPQSTSAPTPAGSPVGEPLDDHSATAPATDQSRPSSRLPGLSEVRQRIARSIQGRAIDAVTLGFGPARIYLIAGIHGDEPEGIAATASIIEHFARDPRCTIRLVLDMNPDGTHESRRTNAAGVDLNRNWPAANFRPSRTHGPGPLSEPESAGVYDDLLDFAPDLVVVFHSASRAHAPFVNFDGPAAGLASAFANAAKPHAINWSVVPSMGYPTPGSLGSLLGIDRGVPILTIEFQRGQPAPSVAASALAGLDALARELAGP